MENKAYILAATRTGTGGFMGSLSSLSAPQLAAEVIKSALTKAGIEPANVNEVILGNVLSANIGQAPARQAARAAGIPDEVDATTINKICSSGIKSVSYAVQSVLLGTSDVVVAGGMESMSNAPYYIENHREGHKTGHQNIIDGMLKDGLWDPYHDFHMGSAAELANTKYGISREEQDEYTLRSFAKAKSAHLSGSFKDEITPLTIRTKKGEFIYDSDEDIEKLNPEKVSQLKPIFETDGSITAANASNLNDGAAILIIVSGKFLEAHNLKPLARIVAFSDAAQSPEWFTTSPSIAIEKTLQKAGIGIDEIDYFEMNEAYANVPIINARLAGVDPEKVNIKGGAVAMGHPLGASGARILVTLTHILQQQNAKYGMAAICNGGGGATAMLIENIQTR
ncbi:MAG: acetyl-CoA acetyltransferase [Fluviicola sp.]|uniref:acetyl-CoA C-acyltransferase n=1 Tax=Fluviicola sp. TaxID=1917219 RepID=UPI002633CE41|nr:acetyl-CoA C-acyltransferase [Fluviicola sp.]MDF3027013.1 acetyl-CoA acetyltransferase [Fluviicola sp.]